MKNEAKTYSSHLEERELRQKTNAVSFTLIIAGLLIAAPSALRAYVSVGFKEIVFICLASAGLVLIALGAAVPHRLTRFHDRYVGALNFIGKYWLRLLMLPIYALTCLVALPFGKTLSRGTHFTRWTGRPDNPDSAFEDDVSNVYDGKPSRFMSSLNRVFSSFANNRLFILLPVVFLLILIGLIFFFISTSSVFGFIYTLF